MPSSTSSSRPLRSPRPLGLLIALVLVGLCEQLVWSDERLLSVLARSTPRGPDGDPLISAAAVARLGRERAARPPVVLLGSSQVREGLDCDVLTGALGRPCHNLAISAGSPLDMRSVQARFDARAPRRTVVLGLFPKVMHMAPKQGFVDGGTLGCVLETDAWRRIGAGAWVDLTYGMAQRLLPTLRFKDGLWAAHAAIGGRWRDAWAGRLPPQPERLLAETAPAGEKYFAALIGRPDGDFPPPGPFTSAQECALDQLIRAEAARGSRALLVDFPTRRGYESTLPSEALQHYEGLRARLRARSDVVFVERGGLPALDDSDFLDFTHLGPAGRRRISSAVAELVARMAP